MRGKLLAAATLAVATLAASAAAPALAQPGQSCFFINQWDGWKAADARTVYIKVYGNRLYRLDMSGACPELTFPDAQLILRNDTNSICNALDWNLKVSLGHGVTTPCIVGKMTQLTPDEAAALPRGVRP